MKPGRFSAIISTTLFLLVALCGCPTRPSVGTQPQTSAPNVDSGNVIVEDVHFRHGDNLLRGSLFRPSDNGPHPAVVLVLGSGEQTRAYGGVGLALGEAFASWGFATLSWDKPGVGQSTGDFNAQTLPDRADEVLAAVHFLQERSDIRRDRIGLWGHSQGGMVAPLAAARSADVAFIIEVSGWQGPAWQQDRVRVESQLRADGFSEADIKAGGSFAARRMELIRGTAGFEVLDREQEAVLGRPWFEYVHRCDRVLFESARRAVEFDSGPSWEKVHCPVLVIYGDKDTLSGPPDELIAIIRRGLSKAGNEDVTVRIFPDADHGLCKTRTGGPKEEAGRGKGGSKSKGPDFVPGYVDAMTGWLETRYTK
jgi:pimeloyl-ACP methyl ester carboxylesterase